MSLRRRLERLAAAMPDPDDDFIALPMRPHDMPDELEYGTPEYDEWLAEWLAQPAPNYFPTTTDTTEATK